MPPRTDISRRLTMTAKMLVHLAGQGKDVSQCLIDLSRMKPTWEWCYDPQSGLILIVPSGDVIRVPVGVQLVVSMLAERRHNGRVFILKDRDGVPTPAPPPEPTYWDLLSADRF